MIRRTLLPFLVLLGACSTPRHSDQWRYDAAAATQAYGEYFLMDNDVMTASERQQALVASRQSADLLPFARFQLSRCALNRAVLIEDSCEAFREAAPTVHAPDLEAYYAMLTGTLDDAQTALLPVQYRAFARARLATDNAEAQAALRTMTPLRSKMIAASTAPELLDDALVESIIDEASYLGYRRAVLAWMRYQIRTTSNADKKALLQRKLELLTTQRE